MRVLNLNNLNFGILVRHPVPRMLRLSDAVRPVRNVQLHIPQILTELVHQLQVSRKLSLLQQKRNQLTELRFVQRRLHPASDTRKIARDRPDIRVKKNVPSGSPFRIHGNRVPRKLQPEISRHPRPPVPRVKIPLNLLKTVQLPTRIVRQTRHRKLLRKNHSSFHPPVRKRELHNPTVPLRRIHAA